MHKLNYKILGFLNRFKGSSSLVKDVNILLLLLTNTKEAKRRHFHVKQTRSSKTASKEIREGKTYESEIGI
jgi:hypothetical protein